MPKYLAKSADVLNEADDFEKRMAYTLFVQEQDQRLFGPSDVEWRPGDPLTPHPNDKDARQARIRARSTEVYDRENDWWYEELEEGTHYGNTPRPMIQDIYVPDDSYLYSICASHCETCLVGWSDWDAPCWICGVHPHPPKNTRSEETENIQHHGVRGMRWGNLPAQGGSRIHFDAVPDPDSDYSPSHDMMALGQLMAYSFRDSMQHVERMMQALGSVLPRNLENHLHISLAEMDEFSELFPSSRAWSVEPYIAPVRDRTPLEVPEVPEDLGQVRPAIAEVVDGTTHRVLDIPANGDAYRREPELPGPIYDINTEAIQNRINAAHWVRLNPNHYRSNR